MDINVHLNNLNRMLQGHKTVITQYHYKMRALKSRLALWEMQSSNNNPSYSSCVKDLCIAGIAEDFGQFKEKIPNFLQRFNWRLQVFDQHETEFKISCSQCSEKPSNVPTDMQLHVIDLLCDSN